MNVAWPCSLHRGQTEAMRIADAELHADEAAAMNGWIDAPR